MESFKTSLEGNSEKSHVARFSMAVIAHKQAFYEVSGHKILFFKDPGKLFEVIQYNSTFIVIHCN